jgi:8-oxo-dGTP diphosphatase
MRRYGDFPQAGLAYRHRPGAYAILPRGNSVLLTYQDWPDAEFQLPGGGVDPGEHPIPALHREVLEETGWHMGPPRRVTTFRRFVFMPDYGFWAEKICHIYEAAPVMRLSPPTEPGHSAVWMPIAEAIERLGNVGDRASLAAWAAQRA